MSTLRTVGAASFSWLVDIGVTKTTDRDAEPWPEDQPLPVFSAEALERVLVPKYVDSLDLRDGWGNPIEVHLNPRVSRGEKLAPDDRVVLFVSAGADGIFSEGLHAVGCYPLADQGGQDIVWADGFFATRPTQDPTEDCRTDNALAVR